MNILLPRSKFKGLNYSSIHVYRFLAVFSKETLQLLSNCQQLGHFSAEMRDCLERQIQLEEPDVCM